MSDRRTELALVATCLDSKDTAVHIADYLRPDMFEHEDVGHAAKIIFDRHLKGEPVDDVILYEEYRRVDPEGKTSAAIDITGSGDRWKTHAASDYAGAIVDSYMRRSIRDSMGRVLMLAADSSQDVADIITIAEEAIFGLQRHGGLAHVKTVDQSIAKVIERIEAAQGLREEGKTIGVPSGFKDLDRITLGWQPTDLIIVAARPSVGKSAFALELARSAGVPALCFSLEMSDTQMAERMLLPEAGIDKYRAMSGHMSDEDWDKVTRAAGGLASLPIIIDDRGGLNVNEIRSIARQACMKMDVGIVIVDYLQLATATVGKGANREREVATISAGLKNMAKELEVPVVALSQLNRIHYTERPDLSNLRESGSIENDADVVCFLWREPDLLNGQKSPILNVAIEKHRHGPLGSTQVTYKPGSARLVPYTPTY